MKEKNKKTGLIIGAIIGLITICAAISFFIYHNVQERARMERWRHYDDKYLED